MKFIMKSSISCFFTILCLVIFSSCTEKLEKENYQTIHVNPEKSINIERSDIFELQKIIEFRSSKDSLFIGQIDDLLFYENLMIIQSPHDIKVFDQNGKFKNTIGSMGNGPGEYSSIYGISCNDERVFVLDRDQMKILQYNLNGKYESEGKINCYGQALFSKNDIHILYSGNEPNKYDNKLFSLIRIIKF